VIWSGLPAYGFGWSVDQPDFVNVGDESSAILGRQSYRKICAITDYVDRYKKVRNICTRLDSKNQNFLQNIIFSSHKKKLVIPSTRFSFSWFWLNL